MMEISIKSILEHEGFKSKPYPDPLTKAEPYTFGHGLTYITEEESIQLLTNRVNTVIDSLTTIKPWLMYRPYTVIEVVVEMGYQLGVSGCLSFRKMWDALEAKDYETAANEMLNSKWAKQTPSRAKALSDKIRGIK